MSRSLLLLMVVTLLVACRPDDGCTTIDAVPLVSIDVAALAADHDLADIEVCMDGVCVHPGGGDDPLMFPDEFKARFDVEGGETDHTVLIRAGEGSNLLGPQPIRLGRVFPNGRGCGGDAVQGWYVLTADGTLRTTRPS